jgi:serine/threonine protein kinase
MYQIVEDNMPPIPEGCSELLQDFLVQCFHKDPAQRPSADILCKHPWLKNDRVHDKVCTNLTLLLSLLSIAV